MGCIGLGVPVRNPRLPCRPTTPWILSPLDNNFCLIPENPANHHPSQLGTFTRGKRKVEDMQRVIAEARRVGAH
jgi:hypothetical protein